LPPLHEGGVDRPSVGRVDDDLRVVLARRRVRGQRPWSRPGGSAVRRDLELHVRARAPGARRVVTVVRPEHVHVTEAIGRDRGLPVVARHEAEALRWASPGATSTPFPRQKQPPPATSANAALASGSPHPANAFAHAEDGYTERNVSGKTTSCAPCCAASAVSLASLSRVASRSRTTGSDWTQATLTADLVHDESSHALPRLVLGSAR
jgi:hypothetical protein